MALNVFSSLFISSADQIAAGTAFKVLSDITSATLDTGTIDTTDYTTIKIFMTAGVPGAVGTIRCRFNGDSTAAHYTYRYSENGGADATDTNSYHEFSATGANYSTLLEITCLNSARGLAHATMVRDEDYRVDWAGRFTPGFPITRVQIYPTAGAFPATSRLQVLGV